MRKGSIEDVNEPPEVAKIRGRVYRHRASVLLYARQLKVPVERWDAHARARDKNVRRRDKFFISLILFRTREMNYGYPMVKTYKT